MHIHTQRHSNMYAHTCTYLYMYICIHTHTRGKIKNKKTKRSNPSLPGETLMRLVKHKLSKSPSKFRKKRIPGLMCTQSMEAVPSVNKTQKLLPIGLLSLIINVFEVFQPRVGLGPWCQETGSLHYFSASPLIMVLSMFARVSISATRLGFKLPDRAHTLHVQALSVIIHSAGDPGGAVAGDRRPWPL